MGKISIIGSGHVGATCAFDIAQRELADVVLLDILEGIPQGKALDMMEAFPLKGFNGKVVGTNNYADIHDSTLVIVVAGFARQSGMSRLDLLEKNAQIVKSITGNIVKFAPESMILMVTNPLDIMTYLAFKLSGFGRNRVFGMSGLLDAARFGYFIALELGVSVEDVSAMVIGAHGDSMVPLSRFSTVSGIPITELLSSEVIKGIMERTRKGGAEIVSHLKIGSAFYAPATAVVEMVKSILKDKKRILPVCSYLDGEYGLKDVCVSVPVKLGENGIEEIIELKLTPAEKKALHASAATVKEGIKSLRI